MGKKKKVLTSSSYQRNLVLGESMKLMKDAPVAGELNALPVKPSGLVSLSELSLEEGVRLDRVLPYEVDSVMDGSAQLVSTPAPHLSAAAVSSLPGPKLVIENQTELGIEEGVGFVRFLHQNAKPVSAVGENLSARLNPPVKPSFADEIKNNGASTGLRAGRSFFGSAGSKQGFINAGLGSKLSYTPPTSDRVFIKISEGLSMQSVWGWSLLGQFVGVLPGHFHIVDLMRTWGVKAKYRVEEGWLFFEFESEVDRDSVLRGGPYSIFGRTLFLKHIPDKFAFNRRDVATIPLWVRVFGLSETCWSPETLGRISSHVGKPLFMDPITDSRERGAYARVLIEINFAEPITREVVLHFDDGESVNCSFLVENEPFYCKGCCSFEHDEESCSFREQKVVASGKSRNATKPPPRAAGKEKLASTSMSAGLCSVVPGGVAVADGYKKVYVDSSSSSEVESVSAVASCEDGAARIGHMGSSTRSRGQSSKGSPG